MTTTPVPNNYESFLRSLKERIRTAQVRAALAVNKELVLLYWQIGKEILERQAEEGWGTKVISRLAKDLKREFPDIKGFSRTNLLYMRAFAETYPDEQIVQQAAGLIPWFHNCLYFCKFCSRFLSINTQEPEEVGRLGELSDARMIE